MTVASRLQPALPSTAEAVGAHARLRLAARLDGADLAAMTTIGDAVGIPRRSVRRAARGRPINAPDYLRLCAALGLDPDAFTEIAPHRCGDLSWASLGIALILSRAHQQFTLRQAAALLGVSYVTLSRIECALPVSVGSLLMICRGLHRSPMDFVTTAPASRETFNCNKTEAAHA